MNSFKSLLIFFSTIFSLWTTLPLSGIEEDIEILIVAQESSPSIIDPGIDPNEGIKGIVWNIYDRLVTFGTKMLPEGFSSYDYQKIKPQLAKSWEYDQDSSSMTFHLRENATFHDGSPVTAQDVKWSLDRAVSVGEYSSQWMKIGGFESPNQFIVIDEHTIKIQFSSKDKFLASKNRYSLAVLGLPVPCIFNSKIAKQHATENDPWATEWLKIHDEGSGPYYLETFIPGVQIVYRRNDEWKSGPLPKLKKVIVNIVQSPEIRKKMLEKKIVDLSFELPIKESDELLKTGKYQVYAIPIESSMRYLDMNVKIYPFNDINVRKAVAYSIPYDEIFKTVHQRGMKLYGASQLSNSIEWPQPSPYYTDLNKAKKLLTNYPNGIKTDLYLDMSTLGAVEPIADLIKENLKKVGIDVTIHKVAGSEWGTEILKKEMPMLINSFGSWLYDPDYFFFRNYHGQNAAFNTMSYQNPVMDKLIESALTTNDKNVYEKDIKEMIAIAFEDVPRIPLIQMYQDVAMLPNVHGFVFWSFRQLAFASMYKTAVNSQEKANPSSEK